MLPLAERVDLDRGGGVEGQRPLPTAAGQIVATFGTSIDEGAPTTQHRRPGIEAVLPAGLADPVPDPAQRLDRLLGAALGDRNVEDALTQVEQAGPIGQLAGRAVQRRGVQHDLLDLVGPPS